ncbi:hypothetical protein HX780_14675 [Pseudomonas tolaasii]|uniref:hypothetical protein n=1 Tax=Pseudomonas tolaasii TaxID=29442 RepID=UPI0015A240E6|nr:hypothetical protein [Pseudomonas tolaasii]NVZ43573.1 hypothetical protein [Pseudomonas tolaasii]NWA49525.1 hypothetical protein [Pseudomonas tolaasii]
MSSDAKFDLLERELFEGHKSIALFVLKGQHYYIVDDKSNFCIDVRPDYASYVEAGRLKQEDYEKALGLFRGGISVLSAGNFHQYVDSTEAELISYAMMQDFFSKGLTFERVKSFYKDVERFLSCGGEMDSQKWNFLRMKLPSFYINFDRRIYRHTDYGRLHEELALPRTQWNACCSSDFGLLIPDDDQYWIVDRMNFWKLYSG